MVEEIKNQTEEKNTVATVWMWFSISWLVAIVFIALWIWCLFKESVIGFLLLFIWTILWLLSCGYLNFLVWFVLGIIWLFYKPRKRARVAVCIPLVIFIIIELLWLYVKKSFEAPVNEFMDWAKPQFEQLQNEEDFDGDRFGDILEIELWKIAEDTAKNMTKDEWNVLYESSTGSNSLEKVGYILSSFAKQWFENSLEKYHDGYIPEIIDEDENNIINVDVQVNNEEEKVEEEKSETVETLKPEKRETFTQSEKANIEQIINILE